MQVLPFARKPMLIGRPSDDSSIFWMFRGPAVIVVPLVPSVGPTPPPIRVVIPLLRQS